MAMKPKSTRQSSDNTERKPFVAVIPEDGLQVVHVGSLVYLGEHKRLPKFAKDNAGKREQDENGNDKIIFPKEGKNTEQRVAVYIDLLNQTHDYEGDIGEKNIRVPLHQVTRGISEGIALNTVAPRNVKDNSYIKGIPWSYAGTSAWNKIAAVVVDSDGKKVSEKMCRADYKNPYHNDISMLLGKPFMFNLEVKVEEVGDSKFVNTKLKNAVPLMKGMAVPNALIQAVAINFEDDDLLEEKEEFGGACKVDLLRIADIRKIVLAEDYTGSKMQEAIRQKYNEPDVIAKAKDIAAKIIESDKDLKEIRALHPEKFESNSSEESQPKQEPVEGEKPKKAPAKKVEVQDYEMDDAPF